MSIAYTHSNDRNGCGTRVIEAKPEEETRHHGDVLVVEGHAKIGEELNDHAEDGEIWNRHLQRCSQFGVNESLVEAANDALNHDKPTNAEGKEGGLRIEERRRIEYIRHVNTIAGFKCADGPTDTEFEAKAQDHRSCYVNLRLLQRLFFHLLLFNYSSNHLN